MSRKLTAALVAVSVLGVSGAAIAYAAQIKRFDNWRMSATADGCAPADVMDEVDGGVNSTAGAVVVKITNDNSTCVYCGSRGLNDSDPVNVNTGDEIGTGASCADGPSIVYETKGDDLGCTSAGAAQLLRVTVGYQQ
jgi:hypothetical protein